MTVQPKLRPERPFFSSGPCAKPPGWRAAYLSHALTGRYHRSGAARERLAALFAKMRDLLGLPMDYRLYLLPGSDTGAFEAALWNLLGPRPVDVLAWDRFGRDWLTDIAGQLQLNDTRAFEAADGELPDVLQADPGHDIIFTWTGTTTGVALPDADWIADGRGGLMICDATSAVFAVDLPWRKLDAVTFSWQKAMGGEAQHGMLILSPRAVERLLHNRPAWPIPKVFRLDSPEGSAGNGGPVNTPSLLCIEDALSALEWIESIGGLPAAIARTKANFTLLDGWISSTPWIDHLSAEARYRAVTPVCLRLKGGSPEIPARMAEILAGEEVAYDIEHYRTAPAGLRIWTGPTIQLDDLERLLPWLEWAYGQAVSA